MNTIQLKLQHEFDYPADVNRLVIAFAKEGMWCSPEQAAWLWEQYSDSMAAGWMGMDGYADATLVMVCQPYFEEITGE
jgi:hypothetical protein